MGQEAKDEIFPVHSWKLLQIERDLEAVERNLRYLQMEYNRTSPQKQELLKRYNKLWGHIIHEQNRQKQPPGHSRNRPKAQAL